MSAYACEREKECGICMFVCVIRSILKSYDFHRWKDFIHVKAHRCIIHITCTVLLSMISVL